MGTPERGDWLGSGACSTRALRSRSSPGASMRLSTRRRRVNWRAEEAYTARQRRSSSYSPSLNAPPSKPSPRDALLAEKLDRFDTARGRVDASGVSCVECVRLSGSCSDALPAVEQRGRCGVPRPPEEDTAASGGTSGGTSGVEPLRAVPLAEGAQHSAVAFEKRARRDELMGPPACRRRGRTRAGGEGYHRGGGRRRRRRGGRGGS